jgi:hypothetical protein
MEDSLERQAVIESQFMYSPYKKFKLEENMSPILGATAEKMYMFLTEAV